MKRAALRLLPFALSAAIAAAGTGCQRSGTSTGGFLHLGGSGDADREVWAIRCMTLDAPERHRTAQAYADALKRVNGLSARLVEVIHDEDGSSVFYGRYERIYDDSPEQRFKPDPSRDLQRIRDLTVPATDGSLVWPFRLATMDLLPTYRSAHPEWDVSQARGYWTLHVAVFYNTQTFRSRRSAAEQYCELLRRQGEEAYFEHGPIKSTVFIGAFPQEAISEIRRENPLTGRVTFHNQVLAPELRALQERFPYELENGHVINDIIRRSDGRVERVPHPSYPVELPTAEKSEDERFRSYWELR